MSRSLRPPLSSTSCSCCEEQGKLQYILMFQVLSANAVCDKHSIKSELSVKFGVSNISMQIIRYRRKNHSKMGNACRNLLFQDERRKKELSSKCSMAIQ
jgi:hypothetical protein